MSWLGREQSFAGEVRRRGLTAIAVDGFSEGRRFESLRGLSWYTPKAIYQINERREVPISTEVAVNAVPNGNFHLQRDSELNSPRSRDETSRASPAVIQTGARRAARGRIGYSESAVLLLLQRLCSGRRACGRKFRECRKHDTAGPVYSVTSMFLDLA